MPKQYASWSQQWPQLCIRVSTIGRGLPIIKRQHAANDARDTNQDVSDVSTEKSTSCDISPSCACISDHISQVHTSTHIWRGYFCARSEATIWLHRRQPDLDGPGHKALKANWLIALSSPFPVPCFWPDASEAQMAARSSLHQRLQHSKLINFTNKDGSFVSSHAQMSDEYHFTPQPTSQHEGRRNEMNPVRKSQPLEI